MNPGTRLGPYEVTAPLGQGGMGEVYRARDTRLGREVAIKVLPQHLNSNPEVRARFEREARTVSSLNHPNICTLFDVGREADTDFLVMELIEGETLAQRLQKGALPPADVLKLGAQIADALDRAHRAGVIHRDLKPGNVMLTRLGAKLMDFGLARATGLAGPGGASGATMLAMTQSPTMAAPLTVEGTIVGTFQYMSPEQLEGREADARSDIWALGCVLYEMTTGKRAFEGATQASLISAIMRDVPRQIGTLAPLSPPGLERLVQQCIAKDPDERWQSAGDVRRELEWIGGGSTSGSAAVVSSGTAPRRAGTRTAALGVAAGAAIAIAALVWALGPWHAGGTSASLVRFAIAPPAGMVLNQPAEAEVSPDGRTLVFTAVDSAGVSRLFVRPLASPEARVVPGSEKAALPFWSPDGRMIGFFAAGKLRKVALDGSPPVDLCDAPDARGGSWSTSGVIVFAPNNQGGLARVPANGGSPTAVTTPDAAAKERGHRYPQFLPDGRHFLYVAIGADENVTTFVASVDGGKPVEVCRGGSMGRYAPPGYLLYLDSGINSPHRRLVARRFDTRSLHASGDAQLVLDGVSATNFGYSNASATAGGTLVAQHWGASHSRLEWRDRHGATTGIALADFDGYFGALSPDGERLAYSSEDPLDLFVRDLNTGVATRLTFQNQAVSSMVWSPDGRRVAFARLSGSRGWDVCVKSADGTGPDSSIFHGPGIFNYPQAWSRDGHWLVTSCSDPSGNFDLWRLPMDGRGEAAVYQHTPAFENGASLSPDGNWVAYMAREGGKRAFFVQSFPEPGAKYQITLDGIAGGTWNAAGDALIVGNEDNEAFEIQVATAGGFRQGATTRLFRLPKGDNLMDVVRGEQRFLCTTPLDPSGSSALEVVLGWRELLAKR